MFAFIILLLNKSITILKLITVKLTVYWYLNYFNNISNLLLLLCYKLVTKNTLC